MAAATEEARRGAITLTYGADLRYFGQQNEVSVNFAATLWVVGFGITGNMCDLLYATGQRLSGVFQVRPDLLTQIPSKSELLAKTQDGATSGH